MLNSGRETVAIAAFFLFGSLQSLNSEQEKKVYELLIRQRAHVQAYVDADMRADYLLRSEQSDTAVIASPFIMKTLIENPSISFQIPQEGGFLVLDSLVIANDTKHEDEVYNFINFLFEKEILHHHFKKYPFIPATQELNEWLLKEGAPASLIQAYSLPINTLHFFRLVLPEERLNHLWMTIKV
jgi:spermidine/putrescine-binding protein